MNTPLEQNYYELLEIPRDATLAEIERAYERARAYYGADSVAVYALASSDDLKRVQDRIDEAFLVLSDEPLRREYDGRLGPPGPDERPSRAEVRRAREEKDVPVAAGAAASSPETPAPEPANSEPPPEPVKAESPAPEPPRPEPTSQPVEAEPPAPEPMAEPKSAAPLLEPPPKRAEPPPIEVAVEIQPPKPEPVAVEAQKPVEEPQKPPEPARVAAEGPLPPPPMAQPEPAPRIVAKRDTRPNESALRPAKPELPPDAIFSGELLRQLRESQGLSLQEIADRTKIGKPHLENIEADRFAALPAHVYLRGFLMSLARELRLDPLRVSKSYLEQMGDAKGRAVAKPRS